MVMAMTGSPLAQGSNNSFWKTTFCREISLRVGCFEEEGNHMLHPLGMSRRVSRGSREGFFFQ